MPNTKSSILYSGASRFKEDGQSNHTLWKGTDQSAWPAAEQWMRHRRGQEDAWGEEDRHGYSDIPMIRPERMHDFDKNSVVGSDCKEKSVTDDTVEDIKKIQKRFEPGDNSVKGLLVLVTQKRTDSAPTWSLGNRFSKRPTETVIGCGTLVSPELLNHGPSDELDKTSRSLVELREEYQDSGSLVTNAKKVPIANVKFPSISEAESHLKKKEFTGLGVASIDRTSAEALEAFEYSS